MQDYYLFVDTETSGLPKNWEAAYATKNNWPHVIQMAWVVYDYQWKEVIRKNFYVKNDKIKIERSAQKIHHISVQYLHEFGIDIQIILDDFSNDVLKYNPILIGHFIEFDYHMINVELYRTGKKNILEDLQKFCTMKASKPYVLNPSKDLLKLNEFYFELFKEEPADFHNALSDALNTAKIFFHLLSKKEITPEIMKQQTDNFRDNSDNMNTQTNNLFTRLFSL